MVKRACSKGTQEALDELLRMAKIQWKVGRDSLRGKLRSPELLIFAGADAFTNKAIGISKSRHGTYFAHTVSQVSVEHGKT